MSANPNPTTPVDKILVPVAALAAVLAALSPRAPAHHIRELQVMAGLPADLSSADDAQLNPIGTLTAALTAREQCAALATTDEPSRYESRDMADQGCDQFRAGEESLLPLIIQCGVWITTLAKEMGLDAERTSIQASAEAESGEQMVLERITLASTITELVAVTQRLEAQKLAARAEQAAAQPHRPTEFRNDQPAAGGAL